MNGTSPTFEEHFLTYEMFNIPVPVRMCSEMSVSILNIKSTLDFFALTKNTSVCTVPDVPLYILIGPLLARYSM
jgi:hypothetical protein